MRLNDKKQLILLLRLFIKNFSLQLLVITILGIVTWMKKNKTVVSYLYQKSRNDPNRLIGRISVTNKRSDDIHASRVRIINRLPPSQESSSCLPQCNWLPIDYLYKRRILLKMHQIFVGAAPSQILDMFSISSRSTRFCNQFNIIRVKSELGRSSLQYRGPNIWNFINKKVKVYNVSKEGLKATLRKYSKDILNFPFNKEAIVISNKKDDFIYYQSYVFIKSTIKFTYYFLLSILIYICLQMYSVGYVERWDTLFSVSPYPILSLW